MVDKVVRFEIKDDKIIINANLGGVSLSEINALLNTMERTINNLKKQLLKQLLEELSDDKSE